MLYRFSVALPMAVCLSLCAAAVYAQLGADGARTGTVLVLDVAIPGDDGAQALIDAGYLVTSVSDGHATVFATLDEMAQLLSDGYVVTEIGEDGTGPAFTSGAKGLGVYHSYGDMTTELQAYAGAHPDIARLTSLGQSVQGRELWALKITDNPDTEEDEPEFKYVSTMHGDEPVGTEMCMYFIDRLLNDYGTDTRITDLVDSTEIWIVPLMNPDGLESSQRFNANGFDLNRSFPEFPVDFTETAFDGEPLGEAGRPPEVQHIMRWTAQNSFVLSANLHTGALVVNYPYDHEVGIPSGAEAISPDDSLFKDLSLRYSLPNPSMVVSTDPPDTVNGIVNGSDWFAVADGMQDWNYRYAGCNEVTIELSSIKTPAEVSLPSFWGDNEESMLSYLEGVHIGIRGIVTDAETGQPVWAKVLVEGNTQPVFTDPDVGDYHRLLLPGTYTIRVFAPWYEPVELEGVAVGAGGATRVDVALAPLPLAASSPWGRVTLAILVCAVALYTRRFRAR
jgi:carboxypeptidase D